ncbi:hypothetical protein [Hydrocarboniphaga effusa]|jgi:hypothetical protein|uniref:hypothetical protein n=1 Tax=Hydrocarboniphaga effusa TaxID=243629 RepID=UPI003BA96A6D
MLRKAAIWTLFLSLVVTRLLGLHAHACAGLDPAGQPHEAPHIADSGLLFGEFHDGDHSDQVEIGVVGLVSSYALAALDSDLPALPVSDELAVVESGWLTVRSLRGPPEVLSTASSQSRLPPLRGPPAYSRV